MMEKREKVALKDSDDEQEEEECSSVSLICLCWVCSNRYHHCQLY